MCDALLEDGSSASSRSAASIRSQSLTSARKILWALARRRRASMRCASRWDAAASPSSTPRRSAIATSSKAITAGCSCARRSCSAATRCCSSPKRSTPSLLTLMWRFGAPAVLLLLACVALALWRAGARFGPLAAPHRDRAPLARRADPRHRPVRAALRRRQRAARGHAARAARGGACTASRATPPVERGTRGRARQAQRRRCRSELGRRSNYSGTRNSHELRNAIAVLETARRKFC